MAGVADEKNRKKIATTTGTAEIYVEKLSFM